MELRNIFNLIKVELSGVQVIRCFWSLLHVSCLATHRMISTFMGEIAKKTIWRRVFFGTQNTVPYCQKYTPTDCSLGYNRKHWQ